MDGGRPVSLTICINLAIYRYSSSARFCNELQGTLLTARNGQPVPGEALLTVHNLECGLSTNVNVTVLAGMYAAPRWLHCACPATKTGCEMVFRLASLLASAVPTSCSRREAAVGQYAVPSCVQI